MNDRAALPPILWPEDIAVVLRLPHERAAREWILKHGLKHVRIGKRVYVLRESLMEFLKEKETRRPSREEIREKAARDLKVIAPTRRQQQRQVRR